MKNDKVSESVYFTSPIIKSRIKKLDKEDKELEDELKPLGWVIFGAVVFYIVSLILYIQGVIN